MSLLHHFTPSSPDSSESDEGALTWNESPYGDSVPFDVIEDSHLDFLDETSLNCNSRVTSGDSKGKRVLPLLGSNTSLPSSSLEPDLSIIVQGRERSDLVKLGENISMNGERRNETTTDFAAGVPYYYPTQHSLFNRCVDDNGFVFFPTNKSQTLNVNLVRPSVIYDSCISSSNSFNMTNVNLNLNETVINVNEIIANVNLTEDGKDVIEIDLDKVSLIGYLIGDTLTHIFVRSCAFLRRDDLKKTTYNDLGYYEFVFSNEQSMLTALEQGKIVFRDSGMILTNWQDRLGFSLSDMVSHFSWVTMYNVPLTLRYQDDISYVASAIRKPICFDQPSRALEDDGAKRILIQLNTQRHKPTCIWVGILDDASELVNVPVRVSYRSTSRLRATRYSSCKRDMMIFKAANFLGCPASLDGLDFDETDLRFFTLRHEQYPRNVPECEDHGRHGRHGGSGFGHSGSGEHSMVDMKCTGPGRHLFGVNLFLEGIGWFDLTKWTKGRWR